MRVSFLIKKFNSAFMYGDFTFLWHSHEACCAVRGNAIKWVPQFFWYPHRSALAIENKNETVIKRLTRVKMKFSLASKRKHLWLISHGRSDGKCVLKEFLQHFWLHERKNSSSKCNKSDEHDACLSCVVYRQPAGNGRQFSQQILK